MDGLNKPAAARFYPGEEGGPRWYLWEGGFFAIGQAGGEVPCHAHHAIQIVLAIEGRLAIRQAGEDWRETRGAIVRADVEHSFHGRETAAAMLFVDPESSAGAWLQSGLVEAITLVPDSRLEACLAELRAFRERPLEALEVGDLVRHCARAFCAGAPPARRLDERIAAVLAAIRASDELRISLEAAAKRVHLSPGRLAHLFKDEVGLPFRRYMLWRKVTRAMLAIGRQGSMAAAAQEGDFADAAHLTRTFHQMFGIPPSVMLRGEFFEIASPFAVPA